MTQFYSGSVYSPVPISLQSFQSDKQLHVYVQKDPKPKGMRRRKRSGARWEWNMLDGTFSSNESLNAVLKATTKPTRGLAAWMLNIHPEDRSDILDLMAQCTDTQQRCWHGSYRLRSKDGAYLRVRDKVFIFYIAGFPVRMNGFVEIP